MIELIHQLLLMTPTVVEVIDDRKGDSHKNYVDLIIRVILVILLSAVSAFLHCLYNHTFWYWLPRCIALSSAYFITFFPYLVNYVQRSVTEDPRWYDHLNDTSFPDNWKLWRKLHWEWRMVILVSLFVVAVLFYAS